MFCSGLDAEMYKDVEEESQLVLSSEVKNLKEKDSKW